MFLRQMIGQRLAARPRLGCRHDDRLTGLDAANVGVEILQALRQLVWGSWTTPECL